MRIALLLSVLLVGCATQREVQWRTYDAGPFTFSLRSDFHKIPAHGIDSYVSEFESRDMRLGFDDGAYSGKPLDSLSRDPNSFQPRPSYASHIESIAGHRVQIVSVDLDPRRNAGFPHFIIASFLKAGLTMFVRCKTTADYESATRIFRSVRFKQPGHTPPNTALSRLPLPPWLRYGATGEFMDGLGYTTIIELAEPLAGRRGSLDR